MKKAKQMAEVRTIKAPSPRNCNGRTHLVCIHQPEINRIEKELTKVRQLFLQLLRNYPDGAISVVDKNYRFITTGGELHKRMGIDLGQLIGHEIYPNFPENARQFIKNELEQVFLGNNLSDSEIPYPLKGQLYVMDAFPLKEEDGSIMYAGVIIRNISGLKMAEEELKRSLKKEKELGELKSRFVTMASHEFRTPLSTVLSSAYLLRKYTTDDTQVNRDKHIARIISSVNLLIDILNDFLSVGKIEEGKIAVKPMTLNIKELIQNAVEETEGIQKKGQRIIYKHTGKEIVVLDPLLLKHIVINLLTNALKFSPENKQVEVKTSWKNSRLVLTVKDRGIGIPAEYRDHLFERFYRASNAVNIQGTGLGLHIISKYVELLNGQIEYTSEIHKGTQFTVTF